MRPLHSSEPESGAEMKVEMSDLDIEGLELTDLRVISDERGAVLHMLRADAPEFTKFGELYFSEVLPGCIKAWKCHTRQAQTFAVPVGKLKIIVFDDRPSSPSRGTLREIQLGRPDHYRRLRIPPGLWYGFIALEGASAMIANCADLPHDSTESKTLPLNDPSIPYDWSSSVRNG